MSKVAISELGSTHLVTARSAQMIVQSWANSRDEAERIADAFRSESPAWGISISLMADRQSDAMGAVA